MVFRMLIYCDLVNFPSRTAAKAVSVVIVVSTPETFFHSCNILMGSRRRCRSYVTHDLSRWGSSRWMKAHLCSVWQLFRVVIFPQIFSLSSFCTVTWLSKRSLRPAKEATSRSFAGLIFVKGAASRSCTQLFSKKKFTIIQNCLLYDRQ